MRLIQFAKATTLALALFCAVGMLNEAHAQFGKKLKDKLEKKLAAAEENQANKPKKEEKPYTKTFTDETGTSGTYSAVSGVPIVNTIAYPQNESAARSVQKTLPMEFLGRDGDKFVNKLSMYYDKDGRKEEFFVNDKQSKILGKRVFKKYGARSIWLIEVEENTFIVIKHKSGGNEKIYGDEKVIDVFAKDAAQLETYDLETAAAFFDQMMSAGKEKEDDKLRARLMEYKAYKQHMEDVVFVDSYTRFQRGVRDKPTEDPKVFLKTRDMGDDLYLAAYFKNKVSTSCGSDCQINIVYEMNGKTGDRVALRNSSAKWNRMISAKKDVDQFCYNHGHSLFNSRENVMDYAFMYTLFQNKDQFKEGQPYTMKVTMYSNRDGNNEEEIADGTITLTYKEESMKNWMRHFTEFYDE